MGKALANVKPLTLPNLRHPDRMPLLPEWVASRLALLTESHQSDGSGKPRRVWAIPRKTVLSKTEKETIELYTDALSQALDVTPNTSASAEAETLVLITKLTLALPGQRLSEAGAEATGEAYQIALDDVPPWAVEAAIRDWYRGDAATLERMPPHDYTWRPSPPVLARLARHKTLAMQGRLREMMRLANAVPLIQYSPQHKKDMRSKLRELPFIGGIIDPEPA